MNDLFKRLDVSHGHLNQQVENQTADRLAASGEQTEEWKWCRWNKDIFLPKKLDIGV